MEKAFKTKGQLIAFVSGLIIVNVITHFIKPYFSTNAFVWFLELISIASIGTIPMALFYLFYEEYSHINTKYLVKFNLSNGEYSVLCDEEVYRGIIEWHNSETKEYIIEKPNGYLRVTKDNLIELSHHKLSKIRQMIEPLLYIAKSPTKFDASAYIKLLLVALIGILGFMYYNNIPFKELLVIGSDNLKVFYSLISIVNSIFTMLYLFCVVKNIFEIFYEKNKKGEWTTYSKTKSFKIGESLALNGACILLLSFAFRAFTMH